MPICISYRVYLCRKETCILPGKLGKKEVSSSTVSWQRIELTDTKHRIGICRYNLVTAIGWDTDPVARAVGLP